MAQDSISKASLAVVAGDLEKLNLAKLDALVEQKWYPVNVAGFDKESIKGTKSAVDSLAKTPDLSSIELGGANATDDQMGRLSFRVGLLLLDSLAIALWAQIIASVCTIIAS